MDGWGLKVTTEHPLSSKHLYDTRMLILCLGVFAHAIWMFVNSTQYKDLHYLQRGVFFFK